MFSEAFIITALGVTASALSTLSLLPQVVRTWRTRSAHDISATWLIVGASRRFDKSSISILVGHRSH
jgi:uncharacterized protein with PQ loop repeat